MAQVKVYGLREHLASKRHGISDVLHGCLVEAFALPPEKRFHRFFLLDSEDFVMPADRSSRYTIVEVLLFEGRSVAAKKALYRLIFERFERELGIAPQDVEVTLIETPRHDWAIRGKPGDELVINYSVDV